MFWPKPIQQAYPDTVTTLANICRNVNKLLWSFPRLLKQSHIFTSDWFNWFNFITIAKIAYEINTTYMYLCSQCDNNVL